MVQYMYKLANNIIARAPVYSYIIYMHVVYLYMCVYLCKV